ncbi:MAG: hypothetical protein WAU81_01480 [Candidatus Aminicenantales bacterium]
MRELIHKAKLIFIILLLVYVLSYAAGFLAGKLNWTDVKSLQQTRLFQFSSKIEYEVPGYSQLLKAYKTWHDKCRLGYLFKKNAWGLGTLFFINNFFVANLTMFIRALFVVPITLTVFGRFFQGVVFAQAAPGGRMLSIFLLEFGGYFLTIVATLNLVFWTLLPRAFRFESRKKALVSGLKLLGLAYLLSGAAILLGSILETRFILRFFGGNS